MRNGQMLERIGPDMFCFGAGSVQLEQRGGWVGDEERVFSEGRQSPAQANKGV
jgi:hypothetical protein